MTIQNLFKLISSLSGSEKRYFRLFADFQSGPKDYLGLFEIMESSTTHSPEETRQRFDLLFPGSSFNNTSRYLSKVLVDSLVQSKLSRDNFFQLLQDIMRARVMQERSLENEGHQLIKRIRRLANESQQHLIEYFAFREELNYSSRNNFPDMDDRTLIQHQMKATDTLRKLMHIHDHHSLLELLKFRVVHSGKISSEQDKKKLNDLVLSEMALVAGKSKNSFASQKLHLLFQSFFFTDTGDFQSALTIFNELNKLFDQNIKLLDNPPLDYLSILNGILESLHILKRKGELSYYMGELKKLDQTIYPEYFRYQVRKTFAVYHLAILTDENKFEEAISYINSFETGFPGSYNMIDEEKQWQIYFYCSFAYFQIGNWKKAHRYISEIVQTQKIQPQLLACKAVRLLDLIIHFEKGDTHYLEYEVRSYKRLFGKTQKLLRCESILLKFILLWPGERRKKKPAPVFFKMLDQLDIAASDKYEKQLLRYFDLTQWIRSKGNFD